MTGTKCPKCNQWELKNNDNYCGYCGHQPIYIELTPDEIILISQIVTQKRVTFINSSAKNTSIRLECVGPAPEPDFVRFEPAGDFIVKGDSQAEIGILLNELPPDFMEQDYRFQCIINNDKRKSVDLSVKVKTGPRPVLLTERIDFENVKEGTIGRKMLKLENQGAIPLKLREIRTEGCDHLQVEEDVRFPVKIMGNQTARISVLWDPDRHNPATDLSKIGYRLIFENYKDDLFVPANARVVQMQLSADKKEILIDPCLSKQNYTEKIKLTNAGNMDVEISAIEADEDCRDWIQIIQGHKTFTLLSSDSAVPPGRQFLRNMISRSSYGPTISGRDGTRERFLFTPRSRNMFWRFRSGQMSYFQKTARIISALISGRPIL